MKEHKEVLPKRYSIRLHGYDYSQEGLYFVTICVKDKVCLFGNIVDDEMVLNDAGRIAYQERLNTKILRKNVRLDEFVIMPNHVHGIIEITDVGANCIRPQTTTDECNSPLQTENKFRSPSQTLGAIIRGYKAAVTKQINKLHETQNITIWQRNYYEHIIRNDESYQKITEYIYENPKDWKRDDYYK